MTQNRLAGWGRYPSALCHTRTARSPDEARTAAKEENQLIARGMGRSYGDAALNPHCTLQMRRTDRLLAFNPATGLLACESGALLSDIITVFLPQGWFPPVTPGTKYVTIGGMLAADVHGKNHHKAGSFGDYVESFDLALADGSTVTCTPTQNASLFAATRGGMGLTGVILRVSFRLMRVQSAYIRRRTLPALNLEDVMAQFEATADSTYSVAWIDCLAQGDALGRSLLYLGEHAKAEECAAEPLALPRKRRKLTVPPVFPSFTINRWSVRAFNELYYRRSRENTDIVDYDTFFYPLDGLLEWNRLYGRKGFVQYQCVLPKAASAGGLKALLSAIGAAGAGSFLAVLKLFGKQNGLISFPMEGYTLALDFPASAQAFALLETLDDIVADHGGRIYLAKDARATGRMLNHYPGMDAFRQLRRDVKADSKFTSLLSERLGI